MNRSVTNAIRFILDECLPPVVRDNKWFMFPFYWLAYRGKLVHEAMNFKRLAPAMSAVQYAEFYQSIDTISRHRETDLNRKCVAALLKAIPETAVRVLDAGCGNAYLLSKIAQARPKATLFGLDVKRPERPVAGTFAEGSIEKIPFGDRAFDVVICSHTLEHCVDLHQAIAELKRVCNRDLLIVVPKQRPYFYTVDEHLQFFFYREQLTSVIGLEGARCENLGGDWFYHASVGADSARRRF